MTRDFCLVCQNSLGHPWMIILAMNVIMLAVGMDTVQLGIMMIINLSIGLYHPPVGTTLFITSSIAKVKMGKVVIELIPFYFVAIGILMLFSFVPAMTLRM